MPAKGPKEPVRRVDPHGLRLATSDAQGVATRTKCPLPWPTSDQLFPSKWKSARKAVQGIARDDVRVVAHEGQGGLLPTAPDGRKLAKRARAGI